MLRSPQGQNKRWLVLVDSSWAHHLIKKAPIGLLIGAFFINAQALRFALRSVPAHKRTAFETRGESPDARRVKTNDGLF